MSNIVKRVIREAGAAVKRAKARRRRKVIAQKAGRVVKAVGKTAAVAALVAGGTAVLREIRNR